jgi:hypothetical protein
VRCPNWPAGCVPGRGPDCPWSPGAAAPGASPEIRSSAHPLEGDKHVQSRRMRSLQEDHLERLRRPCRSGHGTRPRGEAVHLPLNSRTLSASDSAPRLRPTGPYSGLRREGVACGRLYEEGRGERRPSRDGVSSGGIRPCWVACASRFPGGQLALGIDGGGRPAPPPPRWRAPLPAGRSSATVRPPRTGPPTRPRRRSWHPGPPSGPLADTLAAARAARFPYVGIGVSAAAAWAPYRTTIKGVTIAVIGVSQVAELASSWVATRARPGEANAIDLGRTLAAVRSARRRDDRPVPVAAHRE